MCIRDREAISELVKGKTLLVIAHRLNTIQNADQILVIDHGQIAQQGTHEELLKQPGIYPVSYTLLAVYKRQGRALTHPGSG